MPRRRRLGGRQRFDPHDFVISDGWSRTDIDGVPFLPSLADAQAAWERSRVATWTIWAAEYVGWCLGPHLHPPDGAVAHDDLSQRASRTAWPVRSSAAEALDAAKADLAALAEFRRSRPRAAATVTEPLDVFSAQLRWFADAAERAGDDRQLADHLLYGGTP